MRINRLTARKVETITKPGRHSDGNNLYLAVSKAGGRSWVYLYRWCGKPTEIGLGSARDVSLAQARALAAEKRALIAKNINPKGARKRTVGATFGDLADQLIASMETGWRSEKHRQQWKMTLAEYCKPLRPLDVDAIATDDVLSVLQPIWQTKPETASRIRGRIERVLDAAKARGLRTGENPARWRGHLDHLLAKRQRLTRGHFAAMPYPDVPAFMRDLRAQDAVAAIALEFAVLTAARSGEALGARWDEIDFERAVWTVPASRMKGGREHRTPLSARALAIAREMHEFRTGEFVFPGQSANKPLSGTAFKRVLRRMKIEGATTHGFRSSFRDWAAECTSVPNEVCEAALAHTIENRAEAAYRRGDLFDKRRALMDAWSAYCTEPPAGKILQFTGKQVTG